MKWVVDSALLRQLYWNEKKSLSEIGRIFDVDAVTVRNRMKEYSIPMRTVSESLKGRAISWADKIGMSSQGRRLTKTAKRKISEARKGCAAWNRGLTKAQHSDRIKYGCKGEAHWAWKGGISNEQNRIRQSSEYKVWRKAVFVRDNWTCRKCGKHGGYLQADHIKGFAEYPEFRFEVSNGQTLCKPCHLKLTKERKQYGKPQERKKE